MQIQEHVSLISYSTMRLGGTAAYLTSIASRQDLSEALTWARDRQMPVIMIGGGSNIVWRDEGFDGLVIINDIRRYEDFDEDGTNHYLTVGSGEVWDNVVERAVAAGLTGIEALSLIPGTAGATPIQNVGAYGQDISQTLVSIEAYDLTVGTFINIPATDCAFGYRTSRFKSADKGRFFITALTLHVMKADPKPPFYGGVEAYLEAQHITTFTPQALRDAVIAIRRTKLPDPAQVANNGSFFANPLITNGSFTQLAANYGDVPHWEADDQHIKLSAAWLVEQAGFKDYHDNETGMATWANQPLVFINEHAKTTSDLMRFKQKIVGAVHAKFGILLQQEPELLP
jgi:UDP-N-acetylmuramate dehydrogenase